MNHNDESYATMLLTSGIRPDREELAEPMTSEEWYGLRARLREKNMRLSDLIGMDMSALIMRIGLSEDEAYRAYLLLSRMLPLSIALEKLAMRGIDVMTYDQTDYPDSLRKRLGKNAPPTLYFSGRPELFLQDAIAVFGAVKPLGDVKKRVKSIVRQAVDEGFVIITDGTAGISEIAREEAIALSGKVIEVLPGELSNRVDIPEITAAIARFEACVVSSEHPDKQCTLESAHSRSKIIYALSRAAFIFGVEKNSGAVWSGACEAIKKRWCQRIYVWDTPLYADNAALIKRGATSFTDISPELFESMRGVWKGDASKQICMFDNSEPV